MKEGKWSRKDFQGTELYNKTLGILGMGRIGSEVAKRALAFGMKVLAYDPYLPLARAKALQVDLKENWTSLRRGRFHHRPYADDGRDQGDGQCRRFCQNEKRCPRAQLRPRGDHQRDRSPRCHPSGQVVGGAGLDVYETEPPPADFPLRSLPQVVMTPHLGASTEEAQENVGIEVAEAITDFLLTEPSATPSTCLASTRRLSRLSNRS